MKSRVTVSVLAACAVVLACSSFAQAQATRTWVSGVGDDVNPCSRTAPCKTFAGAISKTASGGEISVLDPGGFGALTITKGITIDGAGTLASVLHSATNGIVVNAGADDVVTLRNLAVNGAGSGLNGIRFLAGRHLHIENCVISGDTAHGIEVAHSGVGAGELSVTNTTITDVGGAAIKIASSAGVPTAQIDDVRINGAGEGIQVVNGGAAVVGTRISHATNNGIVAETPGARVNVEKCVVDNSGVGVRLLAAGSMVLISNCDIVQNRTGVQVAPGAKLVSFKNNRIQGNTTNALGRIIPAAQK